jgi:hypothetical protein
MKYDFFKPCPGIVIPFVFSLGCLAGAVHADQLKYYSVTIDNLTELTFSPHVAVTHEGDLSLAMKSKAASSEPEMLASNGTQSTMFDHLSDDRLVTEVIDTVITLAPDDATTFWITARPGDRLSLAKTLTCASNGVTTLKRAHLPQRGAEVLWITGISDSSELGADAAESCSAFTPASLPRDSGRHEKSRARITVTRISNDTDEFLARLSGAGEVPPIQADNDAWGQADLSLNADNTELNYRLKALRIKSGVTRVRIHQGRPSDNGPVVAYLFEPSASDSDERMNTRGRLTQSELMGPLAGDFEGFVTALRAGELYINVHSNAYPQGEIRGQVGAK